MARSKRKKRASVGVLFWIAFILFVAVVFLYNKQNIENVLETTGLVDVLSDRVGLSEDEEPEVTRTDGDDAPAGEGSDAAEPRETSPESSPSGSNEPEVALDPASPEEEAAQDRPTAEPDTDASEEGAGEDGADTGDNAEEPDSDEGTSDGAAEETRLTDGRSDDTTGVQPRRRTSQIYFIRVTDDGTIYPEQVERIVSYVDSPMTKTLNTLLEGPTPEELNVGLLNLIPENTRLLSASVQDGVAYLNFNESFRFNPMGVEGFVAQLQQIIYSTTEFQTVERVQILIEGKRVEYLGGEGIYIGEPISRNTFG